MRKNSYIGRHRAPSPQRARKLARNTALTAGAAATSVGMLATPAMAAGTNDWDAVAERTLDAQGPGAWPVCGKALDPSAAEAGAAPVAAEAAAPAPEAPAPEAVAPAPETPAPAPEAAAPAPAEGTYEVQSGDTLSDIAARQNPDGGWQALYELNRDKIANPDLIFPGQDLAV